MVFPGGAGRTTCRFEDTAAAARQRVTEPRVTDEDGAVSKRVEVKPRIATRCAIETMVCSAARWHATLAGWPSGCLSCDGYARKQALDSGFTTKKPFPGDFHPGKLLAENHIITHISKQTSLYRSESEHDQRGCMIRQASHFR
jgi:hypothetical protein